MSGMSGKELRLALAMWMAIVLPLAWFTHTPEDLPTDDKDCQMSDSESEE